MHYLTFSIRILQSYTSTYPSQPLCYLYQIFYFYICKNPLCIIISFTWNCQLSFSDILEIRKRNIFYIIYILYFISLDRCKFLFSIFFLLPKEHFFNISCSANLLLMNPFSFFVSERYLSFCLHFLKYIFSKGKILNWKNFST